MATPHPALTPYGADMFSKVLIANRGDNKALRAAVAAKANRAERELSSRKRAAEAKLPALIQSHVQ